MAAATRTEVFTSLFLEHGTESRVPYLQRQSPKMQDFGSTNNLSPKGTDGGRESHQTLNFGDSQRSRKGSGVVGCIHLLRTKVRFVRTS